MESACTVHGKYIVKTTNYPMHKDAEEMEVLCQSAVRDGVLKQLFTDQEMLHRKALVSSLAVLV